MRGEREIILVTSDPALSRLTNTVSRLRKRPPFAAASRAVQEDVSRRTIAKMMDVAMTPVPTPLLVQTASLMYVHTYITHLYSGTLILILHTYTQVEFPPLTGLSGEVFTLHFLRH